MRFVIVSKGRKVTISGRRDYGNNDENKFGEKDNNVDWKHENLFIVPNCKYVDYKRWIRVCITRRKEGCSML